MNICYYSTIVYIQKVYINQSKYNVIIEVNKRVLC